MTIGHGEKLSRKKELAVAALLTETSLDAAAQKAGVGVQTLKNWLKLPGFQQDCRAARKEILDQTLNQLLGLAGNVVDTLRKNMKCGNPTAENRAAELAWSFCTKGMETADLAEQVEELTRELEGMKNVGRPVATPSEQAPGSDPAADPGGQPDADSDTSAAGAADGVGGVATRSVAAPPLVLPFAADDVVVFPSER